MRKIILFILLLISFASIVHAGEWKMRNRHPSARHDWVRGDDPVFNDVTISNSLSVSSISPVNYIDFRTDYGVDVNQEARLHWDDDAGTLELGMPGGNVKAQLSQEGLVRCTNKSGSDIVNGKVVYMTGSQGNRPTIDLADTTDSDTWHILGLATEDIGNNKSGYVALWGDLSGDAAQPIDTSDFAEGDKLYLSTSGDVTNSHPLSANAGVIIIGNVQRSHATEGTIRLTDIQTFSIGNNYNGSLRQTIRNKNTGTSAASFFTAVNDAERRATFGIFGSNNAAFPGNATVMYNEGYGPTGYAIDGNEDHIWYTDPTDSHDFSALNYERMRLYANGDLSVGDCLYVDESTERVGIGTTTPSVKLEVDGDLSAGNCLYVDKTNTRVEIADAYTGTEHAFANEKLIIDDSTDTLGTAFTMYNDNSAQILGNELLMLTAIAARGNAFVMAEEQNNRAWGFGNVYLNSDIFQIGYIPDYTDVGFFKETETMREANGLFFIDGSSGYTGINTGKTPRRRLDVLDASNPQFRLTHTGNSVYTDFQTTSAGELSIMPTGSNVGIGIADPVAKLHLYETGATILARLETANETTNGRALLQLLQKDGANQTGFDFGYNISQSDREFTFRELSAGVVNYRFVIEKTGVGGAVGNAPFIISSGNNVGINTSGPDRRLDILDASNPQLRLTHTDGSVYTDLQTDASGDLIILPSGDAVGIEGDLTVGDNLTVENIIYHPGVYGALQLNADSAVLASDLTLSNGTSITGVESDTYTINQVYWQVQETGKFAMDFIFETTVSPARIIVHGRYEGNPAHDVFAYAYNEVTDVWDRLTSASQDFPDSATDDTYEFVFGGSTNQNYLRDDNTVWFRIFHDSSAVSSHYMYVDYIALSPETVGMATAGTDYRLLNVDAGISSNMSISGENAAMQIQVPGAYEFNGTISFSGCADCTIEGKTYKNGAEFGNVSFKRKLGSSGDVGSAAGTGMFDLVAGDILTFYFDSDQDNSFISIDALGLTLKRIGD